MIDHPAVIAALAILCIAAGASFGVMWATYAHEDRVDALVTASLRAAADACRKLAAGYQTAGDGRGVNACVLAAGAVDNLAASEDARARIVDEAEGA